MAQGCAGARTSFTNPRGTGCGKNIRRRMALSDRFVKFSIIFFGKN